MKEKDKEGADREEETEGRQKINYRWTQKTQVTAIRRQRDQPSEKEDRQVQTSMEISRCLKYRNTVLDTEIEVEGHWVAQLVECLTAAQVMISRFLRSSPPSGLWLSAQNPLQVLCPPLFLSAPPPLILSPLSPKNE